VLAHCRLAGVQQFGGLGKAFRFVYGNEDLQVTCFDGGGSFLSVLG